MGRASAALVASLGCFAPVACGAGVQWAPCPVFTYAHESWNTTPADIQDLHPALSDEFGLGGPLRTPVFNSPLVGDKFGEHFASECTFASVPLDYENPALREIDIFVKRLSPRQPLKGAPSHAVWLLSGGPGDAAADDVEPLHALLAERLQPLGDFEVFITDHRGVAQSTRLGCRWSQAEAPGSTDGVRIASSEWGGCLESLALDFAGGRSRHFSTSNAARDVHLLMERFRRPGQSVSVYGISYGTYWAGRYARIFPGHARAVVLDGVVSASGVAETQERLTFERWDKKLHVVGVSMLDQKCGQDEFCSSKLGPLPSKTVGELFHQLGEAAHCAQPLQSLGGLSALKRILGGLLYGWSGRAVATALLYRLMRCDAGDVAALSHFAAARKELAQMSSCCGVRSPDLQAPPLHSDMLLRNIVLSEIWDPTATEAQMRAWTDGGWFSMAIFNNWLPLRSRWPLYEVDPYFNTSLRTSSPVLLMNGDMDCQTPVWSARREREAARSAGGVTLLEWPGAVHFSVLNTPVEGGGDPCGLTAVAAFLSDPRRAGPRAAEWRDPPCRQRLRRIDFRGSARANELLWGTPDAYEGAPRPGAGGGLAGEAARAGPSGGAARVGTLVV